MMTTMSDLPPSPSDLDPTRHPGDLVMRQRLTLMVNRYAFTAGDDGPLIAFAQQKRMAFKEEVTFYVDEERTRPVFSFKARQRMDLGAVYDVFDDNGRPIGYFKKDFGRSLMRSTWHLGVPGQGLEATGRERNVTIAVIRRLWEFIPLLGDIPIPWQFHFDFLAGDVPVLTSNKRIGLRDTYDVSFPAAPNGDRLDWRVGACVAVALDALQSR